MEEIASYVDRHPISIERFRSNAFDQTRTLLIVLTAFEVRALWIELRHFRMNPFN